MGLASRATRPLVSARSTASRLAKMWFAKQSSRSACQRCSAGLSSGLYGGQEDQAHVLRHGEIAGDVPAGLIHDHHDELGGVALRHLAEEQRHRLGADPGQHEAVEHTVVRADGAEGVEILALQSRTDHGPSAARCPAAPRCAQQAESAFVLEHQTNLAAAFSLARDLLAYRAAQFF
jgi:hypothetical protein